jgi:hypothetical protein
VFQHRANDRDIELAQLLRKRVNVSVINICFRIQQPVTKPVRILPLSDPGIVLIVCVKLSFEWHDGLLAYVAHVE